MVIVYSVIHMRAVFLDRDGTITVGVPKYERVDSVDKVELLPKVMEGLRVLAGLDFAIFFVTNQAGIGEGIITEADFGIINDKVLELIAPSGIKVIETYFCPHAGENECACRKPSPKMLLDASQKYDIDLTDSFMVGDRLTDVETGMNAGTKTILVQSGAELTASGATYIASDFLKAAQYIASH